jgi:hypothetical protein
MYHWLADAVVLIHLVFVIFVVTGGFLVIKWPKFIYAHIPAAIWGAMVEFFGWICPLTPLENWLRRQAGQATYDVSFVERYVVPLIYPSELTRQHQVFLGILVVAISIVAYAIVIYRWRKNQTAF